MEFKLPNLGEGVDSGEVVGVTVKAGDTVDKGASLCEVETNKAVMDVTANFSGKVTSVNVKPGDKVKPGQVVVAYEPGAGAPSSDPAHLPNHKNADQRATPRPGQVVPAAAATPPRRPPPCV